MLLCFLATVAAASAADGSKFSISNTLGSHAVLQNPVIIWGYGVPGESISTTVAQDQVSLNVLIGLLLHRSGHAKWTCSWSSRPRFLYPSPPHLVNRFVVVYTLCMSPHYSHSHASSSFPLPLFQWHQKEQYNCVVGADGIWRQPLEPLGVVTARGTPGPEPYTIASTSSTMETITLSDILVGKVILCSGMYMYCTHISFSSFSSS